MIKNRAASLFIILLIYILATVCDFFIFTFFVLKFSLVLSLLLADIQMHKFRKPGFEEYKKETRML